MAHKVQVIVTCDLHDDEAEGVETVRFGVDGHDYEIDLCAEHSEQVHSQLQELVARARPAGGTGRARRAAPSAPRPQRAAAKAAPAPRAPSDRERVKTVRAWARTHGYPDLSDRGRIPRAVVEEYEAAHRR